MDGNVSLLKPYTKFDEIKNMNINEMIQFIFDIAHKNYNFCLHCVKRDTCKFEDNEIDLCFVAIRRFLERKVEK